jgi:hypothetical protein
MADIAALRNFVQKADEFLRPCRHVLSAVVERIALDARGRDAAADAAIFLEHLDVEAGAFLGARTREAGDAGADDRCSVDHLGLFPIAKRCGRSPE